MLLGGLLCVGVGSAQQATVQVKGTVKNAKGVALAGALVQLREPAGVEVRAVTNAAGKFVLPAVSVGDATVTASAQGMEARVEVPAAKLHESMVLVLRPSVSGLGGMQFSDAPTFSVAGVTDWTAVGGHGSDATLRTSESLATETASLPAGGADAATPEEMRVETEVRADEGRGQVAKAQSRVHDALRTHPTATLYRLAGEVDEKGGDPLTAVHEFKQAATLEPSEANEFAWGSDLLVHRAVWEAVAVFERGVTLYPSSVRMQTALGAALFAGARYEQAAEHLCRASDLAPGDVEPYEFMGKAELAAPDALDCAESHLARYVQLKPKSAEAHYLYAMAILKQQERTPDAAAVDKAEALLERAVALDAKCAEGYLELGVLASQRKELTTAMGYYSKAIDADPTVADAYYRLAKAYERMGQHEKAKAMFAMHDKVMQAQAAATQKQRLAVKQFLFAKPGEASAATP